MHYDHKWPPQKTDIAELSNVYIKIGLKCYIFIYWFYKYLLLLMNNY